MEIQSTLNMYADLMNQIKSRHNILLHVADNNSAYPDWAVAEFCNLQIRMICETFALACLVAHGDVPGTRSSRLVETYKADMIVNALEKLHPHFYPRPTRQVLTNGVVTGWEDAIGISYLTKDDLLKSYRSTGDYLHAGDLRDLMAKKERHADFKSIIDWTSKVVALLGHHNIYLADELDQDEEPLIGRDGAPIPMRQIVSMMNSTDGGNVQVTFFRRMNPNPRKGAAAP